jgi:transcriptional regulator with XRE-family HTH domain
MSAPERSYNIDPAVFKRRLNEMQVSLDKLSGAADVSRRTLRRWLEGKPGYLDNITRVAKVLEIAPKDLIDWNKLSDEKPQDAGYDWNQPGGPPLWGCS